VLKAEKVPGDDMSIRARIGSSDLIRSGLNTGSGARPTSAGSPATPASLAARSRPAPRARHCAGCALMHARPNADRSRLPNALAAACPLKARACHERGLFHCGFPSRPLASNLI